MKRFFSKILNEDGQDLIEYSLLIAFVALTCVGMFLGAGQSVTKTWSSANSVLAFASGSPPASGGGGHRGED